MPRAECQDAAQSYIKDMDKICATYLVTNFKKSVLYTGVTSDLIQRIHQHKTKSLPGFTSRYNATILVYYERFTDIRDAIAREKQIKAGSRKKKIELINSMNPQWIDLYEDLLG